MTPSRTPARSGGSWLLAGLVLGLVRCVHLGRWSLWYDEGLSVADGWHAGVFNYNEPGYAILRWAADALGGPPDEWSLRLLPALVGWLCIPLTFWAFLPLAGGRRAGLAALLVAVSGWQLYWSQNARMYTLAEFTCLLGVGLHVRGLLAGRGPLALGGALVVAAGAVFELQAAVLFGALACAPWLLRLVGRGLPARTARPATWVLVGALLGGLASSVWVYGVWRGYSSQKQEIAGLAGLAHFLKSTGYFLTPLLGVAALIGTLGAARHDDREHLWAAAVCALGVGAVALLGVTAQVTAQYVFVFLPFAALLAAWPLEAAWVGDRRVRRLAWCLLLVGPALADCALYLSARAGERSRWRDAYAYVWNQREADDLVLGMQAGLGDFYVEPGFTDARYPRQVVWADRTNQLTFAAAARQTRPVWIVVRPDFFAKWPAGSRQRVRAFLREECRLMRRFEVGLEGRDLDLEVYYRAALP